MFDIIFATITEFATTFNTAFAFSSVLYHICELSLQSKKVERQIPAISKNATKFVVNLTIDLSSLYPLIRGLKKILLKNQAFQGYFKPIVTRLREAITSDEKEEFTKHIPQLKLKRQLRDQNISGIQLMGNPKEDVSIQNLNKLNKLDYTTIPLKGDKGNKLELSVIDESV